MQQPLNHFFRILQGVFVYGYIMMMIYLSLFNIPLFFEISNIILFLLSLLTLKMFIYFIVGIFKLKSSESIDWVNMYIKDTRSGKLDWDSIRHYIMIPNYKESFDTLDNTLNHLSKFNMSKSHFCIVLAMEEREKGSLEKAEKLVEKYKEYFKEMLISLHPPDLVNEIPGKASNENWAAHFLIRQVEEKGYDIKKCIVSVTDADSLFHLNYFDCLTYKYCTDSESLYKTYQSPILCYKNYYDVPALLRILAAMFSTHEVACLSDPFDHHIPFSSYSLSLFTIKNVQGWDADNITEDWHMYLKTYFYSNGQQYVEPILLPTTNYILESEGYFETLKNRYIQAQRHMWSFYEQAYLLQNSVTSPMTWIKNPIKTISLHLKIFYIHYLAVIPLPTLVLSNLLYFYYFFIEGDSNISSISFYSRLFQNIAFLLSALTILLNHFIIRNVLKGKESQYGFKSSIFYGVLEYVTLNTFSGLFFAFIPSIHSLTKLMFTDKLQYVVAQKPSEKKEEV